ncbi:phosphotransferase enzyme family protein [Veronia pacifica]|uniref:Phosphotransferase n=1 Tax=Veronia pacifica TaxID=1080227 RepID=A0A1C3EG95_9GAMM|nr:aminoglycoside phosphotransferase family protein [Veronia pacifica]ODA32267.1 phosphotransferase [Veronia pacifica]
MEVLSGGRERSIYRDNQTVIRPAKPWSNTIHALLTHLHLQEFTQCPHVIALTPTEEQLSYVEGDTFDYPLNGHIASTEALISAAKLLRNLHDASIGFLKQVEKPVWMLPAREPTEVICHGDFAPYNVALDKTSVSGVFDFDTAHPGPRIWDLAYSVYCWAPFKTHEYDSMGTLEQQIERAKIFLDAYDASKEHRHTLVEFMIIRLESLIAFMVSEAESGDRQFDADLSTGHGIAYQNDITYLRQHNQIITSGIT